MPGLLDLASLWQIYAEDRPDLKEDPFVPATHPRLAEGEKATDVFAALREGDVLVHHPYESFATSVQRFIEQAAADPHVLAIKQTLYRTSGDSPIVDALVDAAQAGKQVVVLVEITARFDEQANIRWARALEKAGCHVVYGLVGLKTHCKTSLVVRQEKGQLRRYAHIGTGNYNPKTARIYEDLGLLTADPEVGADLTDLFNTLTGYSRQTRYRTLMVAPHGVRAGLVERIGKQAERARQGQPSRVRLKANSIVDEAVIDALYGASRAGVPVELVVRGICALRPGVPGLSETISVRSIVGRFLEHSRVMAFGDPDDGEVEHWLGSADLMHRNLDRRVETLVRLKDPVVQRQVDALLDRAMAPDTRHWALLPDGCWEQRPGRSGPRHAARPHPPQQRARRRLSPRAREVATVAKVARVRAAGGVLWREVDGQVRVAVVHRPRYDDWSLPKGKLDPGELEVAAAVREVEEETGFTCVVGRGLGVTRYRVLDNGRDVPKRVRWWALEATERRVRPGRRGRPPRLADGAAGAAPRDRRHRRRDAAALRRLRPPHLDRAARAPRARRAGATSGPATTTSGRSTTPAVCRRGRSATCCRCGRRPPC